MGFLPQCNATLENDVCEYIRDVSKPCLSLITCTVSEVPVWHNYTYHVLGRFIGGCFAAFAIVFSFFLIFMHATHYLRPWEQRHIIRILFMVPIYATVSWLSFAYYRHAIYFEVVRDCYEAFAIASFFTLICHYIAQDLHEQKNYFRAISPRNWIWPIPWLQKCCGGKTGAWRTPRSGLTWFNVIWTGVFQYCFIRVFMTFTALITQALERYCQESLSPAFAHVWVICIEAAAVTIAMYCIIQFYIQVRNDIRQHKPLLKVAAIKLVIFLSFWQTIVISFATSTGAIKPSPKFQTPDIKIGIPNFLICVEMAFFALFHLFAFSWKPYTFDSKEYQSESVAGETATSLQYVGGFLGIKAYVDALNPWDFFKAVARAGKWLFIGRRKRYLDSSYAVSRTGREGSGFRQDETAYSGTKLNPLHSQIPDPPDPVTYYHNDSVGFVGAGPIRPNSKKSPSYSGPVGPGPEGQQLLSHAQSNPLSDPAHRDPSPYSNDSDAGRDVGVGSGDIGVAKTTYGREDEDDGWEDTGGRGRMPMPVIHIRAPSGQETDVPYPDHGEGEERGVAMPYFAPPPTNDRAGRSGRR
jgi:hypothetical protein